jgi:hypothetical protein
METELDNLITKVRDALENAGLHTWEISDGIVNVHTQPVLDESQAKDDVTYLGTVTVTIAP